MTEEIIDKILDRYGVLGGLTLVLALMVLILVWIYLCIVYPIFIFVPVLLAAWMVGKVMGEKDE